MDKPTTVYVGGLFGKEKAPNAPDFVICKLTAKRDELIAFLQGQKGEYVNMDVVKGRDAGKLTVKLDTWKPDPSRAKGPSAADEEFDRMSGGSENPGAADSGSIPF